MSDKWVLQSSPRAGAQVRLLCIPPAGLSAAAYRPWVDALAPTVEVLLLQLPGRGGRLKETSFTRMRDLVQSSAPALRPYAIPPFAIFGHSLGALVGFELAREFRRRGWPEPSRLIVSGRRAPQIPESRPPVHRLPDAALVHEVRSRYDGIPDLLLRETELMQLLLPGLRADFEVLETYDYQPEAPLRCPIAAFGGDRDSTVRLEELDAWRVETEVAFERRVFPGGHFFVQSAQPLVLEALAEELAGMHAGQTAGRGRSVP